MSLKILFFIDSLYSGGKERRLVELLYHLKRNTDYQMKLVLTESDIHYTYIEELGIQINILKRGTLKKDPSLFYSFYKIVKEFNPDIINTWGKMTTFYAIPAKLLFKKKLYANIISDAKRDYNLLSLDSLFYKINFYFSDLILGNSEAGFRAYNIHNKKKRLIYNGVRLERFNLDERKLNIRHELKIQTTNLIIMVASTSKYKDYDLFLDVAKQINLTYKDVTFIGVGDGSEYERLKNRIVNEHINNIILTGKRNDVEGLIAVSDIGVLFSNNEGISNSIIEYMALGKPVITTDIHGGSSELIEHEISGFIIEPKINNICKIILKLLRDKELMNTLGKKGRHIIENKFTIEKMGNEYINIFSDCKL
jgi:glycosyltransferase involved in cell wall biosynthesis